jgi:hypothetical protein
MGGAHDEFKSTIAQCLERFRYRKQQIDRGIVSFFFEKPHLHGGDNREIGVRDQVRNSNP